MNRLKRFADTQIHNMNLGKKLLISYILFAVFPILIIGSFVCLLSFRIMLKQTKEYANLTIERINNEADDYIEGIERQSYSVYTDQEIQEILKNTQKDSFSQLQNNNEYIQKRLIGMWVMDKYIVGSYLCGANGNAYYTNINERTNIHPQDVFSGESWYETITNGSKKGVWTGVHSDAKYSDASPLEIISYIHAVSSIRTGDYLGYLVIDIDTQILEQFVSDKAQILGGAVSIIDKSGTVMYSSDAKTGGKGYSGPFIALEHTSPKTGWIVRTEISWFQFGKEIVKVMLLTACIAAVCFFVFVRLSKKLSRGITAPIEELQRAIERVDEGDLEVTVTVIYEDEIGKLSRSFNNMVANMKHLIEKVYLTQLAKKEAEFSALQSQINPHFMYNTLETVNMMAILDGNYAISDVLTAFGKILRVNLDQKHNIITLKKELEYIRNYLIIMQMRDKELFDFAIEASEEAENCTLPKLTLQPIVENSILHGFQEKLQKRMIKISAEVQYGIMTLIIQDDGKGMTPEKLEYLRQSLELEESLGKDNSIGLNNVNERCHLYFEDAFSLKIDSTRGVGTTVMITAPMIVEKESGNGETGSNR